jgi:hypothetical protein
MKSLSKWALAGMMLALAAAPVLAQPPITVAPGNDSWVSPANGSQIDLVVFPLDQVFGPSPVVNPTKVWLSGSPLDTANLGSADTLMERYPPSVVFSAPLPETKTFSVEIKALRLRGQTVVNGRTYNLVISLSETPSGPGTITATRLTADGGRFSSSFPVLPKLTFTEVGNPGNRVVLDCGVVPGCPTPLTLGASNVCWEVAHGPNNFDPATKGITPIRAGIAVDGTFNGVAEYTTVGRARAGFAGLEFHTGYDPAPPWGICGGGSVRHDHAVYSLYHVATPPTDCATTGTTGTATSVSKAIAVSKLCDQVSPTPTPVDPSPTPADPKPIDGTLKRKPATKPPGGLR